MILHKTTLIHNVLPAVLLLKDKSLSFCSLNLQADHNAIEQVSKCRTTVVLALEAVLMYVLTLPRRGVVTSDIPNSWQLRINLCCLLLRNKTEQFTQEKISNCGTWYLSPVSDRKEPCESKTRVILLILLYPAYHLLQIQSEFGSPIRCYIEM